MNFLALVGGLTILIVLGVIFYVLVIDPIQEMIIAWKNIKRYNKLQSLESTLQNYIDRLNYLTNQNLKYEYLINNKTQFFKALDQLEQAKLKYQEHLQKHIKVWSEYDNIPSIPDQEYYNALKELNEIKKSLGLK